MEPLRCTRCGRPFTAGEVTGLGILRSRLESQGGPLMDFACPDCDQRMRLIPYGQGRYAFPGEPPPPWVPEAERVPPWVGRRRAAPRPPAEPTPTPPEPEAPEPPPFEIHPPPATEGREEAEEPLTPALALQILGVGPEAEREEIERAFRERSRTCHPDKVAHLDPEFQALAERKFKRLRGAYDLLTAPGP